MRDTFEQSDAALASLNETIGAVPGLTYCEMRWSVGGVDGEDIIRERCVWIAVKPDAEGLRGIAIIAKAIAEFDAQHGTNGAAPILHAVFAGKSFEPAVTASCVAFELLCWHADAADRLRACLQTIITEAEAE